MVLTKLKPNEKRGSILLIFLRIHLGLLILKFIFEVYRYSLWAKIYKGIPITQESLIIVELICFFSSAILILLFITCVVLFIAWLYRAYENYIRFQFQPPRFSLYWTALAWFVPFINLRLPYLLMSEVIESYEAILIQRDFIRYKPSRHIIKSWWWITIVGAFLALAFIFSEGLLGYFFLVIAHAFLILSGILVVKMISDIKMMEKGLTELKDVTVDYGDDPTLLDNEL